MVDFAYDGRNDFAALWDPDARAVVHFHRLVGGVFRFEIDNAAFALWSIVAHAGWVSAQPATEYLRARDTVVRAAELLTEWRDADTGLHWPAQEDDHAAYTQTLNGAVPVFAGLVMAARAARLLGEAESAVRWEDRAIELRAAIVEHLYGEEAARFVRDVGASADPSHGGPTGTTGWMVWPAHVYPWDDPRVRSQLQSEWSFIGPQVRLETMRGQYFMKNTVAFGLTYGREDRRPELEAWISLIGERHATDTGHFGEAMATVRDGSNVYADQRVANPHLWERVLFYLSAMALEDPDALLAYDAVLPEAQLDREPTPPPSGCSCRAGPRGSGRALAWVALVALAFGRGRRAPGGG